MSAADGARPIAAFGLTGALARWVLVLIGGILSLSPVVVGQEVELPRSLEALDRIAKALDRDGNGEISRTEAAGASWFDRLDFNGDGVISADEYQKVRQLVLQRAQLKEVPEVAVVSTEGPQAVRGADLGVGRMVESVEATALSGERLALRDFYQKGGLVVAMTSATCPVSKRYLPSLKVLGKDLQAMGWQLLLVNPFASESREDIESQLGDSGWSQFYVQDGDQVLVKALRPRSTTEVFLIDRKGTLVYRGALDDQYGVKYSRDEAQKTYLRDAIARLQAGQEVAVAATEAPGCELPWAEEEKEKHWAGGREVTYHRDVARILQRHCVECHRDGGIAPFALDQVDEVLDRVKVIGRVVREGSMPPWFAAPPADGGPSPWANDCSLSAGDLEDLLAWLTSADKPLGDPEEAPLKPVYPEEWSLGTPDKVLTLSRPYEVKATGFMPYQFDVVETGLEEDVWVQGYEILPSERDVVHHVIVQVHEKGSEIRDRGEGASGYWAAYVPGNGSHRYEEGFARRLPAGSKVSFQIHYTPSGVAKTERLRMGLIFAEKPPQYEVKTLGVADLKLDIPPGAADHLEWVTRTAPFDIPVMSLMAHMHVRGKAFRFEVRYPDGREEILLDLPNYDFNWQLRYDYREPKVLPRGSVVRVSGKFDNSANNPANPDPGKRVRWGPQTVDEMLIGYIEYFLPVLPSEKSTAAR